LPRPLPTSRPSDPRAVPWASCQGHARGSRQCLPRPLRTSRPFGPAAVPCFRLRCHASACGSMLAPWRMSLSLKPPALPGDAARLGACSHTRRSNPAAVPACRQAGQAGLPRPLRTSRPSDPRAVPWASCQGHARGSRQCLPRPLRTSRPFGAAAYFDSNQPGGFMGHSMARVALGAAQRTALAITRWTLGSRKIGNVSCPGRK